ncbi:MAG: AMP-binding protein [Pseudomonadota bacterium]
MSDLAERAAQRFAGRTAISMDSAQSLSFTEINVRAARFAGGLCELGIAQGDRVVLYLPNCLEWIVAYHAIARLGGVVVPANILLTHSEVGFIAANSQARAIVCEGVASKSVKAALTISKAPTSILIVTGESEAGVSFEQVATGQSLPPRETQPGDLFTIAYTSGTTGTPKGAMITHRAVYESTTGTATIHVRHSGDKVLSALPLPHVYGNVVMNAAFVAGYELFILAKFDAEHALQIIKSQRITLFEGVPTMYYQMLQSPDLKTAQLKSLTRCTVGGQTMPTASIEEVESRFGCPILELWGMTELAGPATSHSPYWPSRHGSIGLPFPGLKARVVDLNNAERPAPIGEKGELQVRGSLVTRGYWKNSVATSEALDPQGWLSTGDVAIEDEDGYIFIVDRRKDMIITAGYNVYPAELEQVIAKHPAVAMAAVAAIPDKEKGELAKAFIVLRQGQSCTEREMLAHCRSHLAAYKTPRLIAFVDDLPKTSTGKIMRRALA